MDIKKIWQVLLVTCLVFLSVKPALASNIPVVNNSGSFEPDSVSVIHVPGSGNISLQTALDTVPNNGLILVSAGTYVAPSAGFTYYSQSRSFTVKALPGETVTLSGNNNHRIMDIGNSSQAHLVFEGITFANGYNSDAEGAGVSVARSNVTFINCVFENNRKTVYRYNIYGGALYIEAESTVFIIDSIFRNNNSEDGGASFATRESTVYVHNSQFLNNQNTSLGYSGVPVGAGANIVNSKVRITNSRFSGNQSAGHGAAIYIIGQWNYPGGSDVLISNSTFENNHVVRPFTAPEPESGGAINIEDNSVLKIYHSNFINNSSWMGGGIDVFRAKVEIHDSVMIGNFTTDTTPNSGFGGAITWNYFDRPDFSYLLIEDTFIQGRYGSRTTVSQYGGGIHAHGNPTSNKPKLTLRRVIMNDLDVTTSANKAALGGALELAGVDLLMEDSLVSNCDARGPMGGFGGGLIAFEGTKLTINRTTFSYNTSDNYGGAISSTGSQLNIDNATFYKNEISPGSVENEGSSYGAAIYTTPDFSKGTPATGSIVNSVFVENIGIPIYDDDRTPSPINSMIFNNNQFYETTYSGKVYRDKLAAVQNPQGLNSLVVTRSGSSTDKSPQNNNQALSNAPAILKLLKAPSMLLPTLPAGSLASDAVSSAYLGYVWNGASAKLDGANLSSQAGAQVTNQTGEHTLSAGGQNASVNLSLGPAPALYTAFNPVGPSITWNVIAGTFLSIYANQGLNLPNTSSGTASIPTVDRSYVVYLVTKEGGVVNTVEPSVPELYAPDKISVFYGLNQGDRNGSVPITNVGGQSLNWTAQTSTPDLIQILQENGTITTEGSIPFTALPDDVGVYQAYMNIDAGAAGSKQVTIEITVVAEIRSFYLPMMLK